jgi:2-methylisocitrate lyase-like PEP mutase family enzyme
MTSHINKARKADLAQRFRALHVGFDPLVLVNVWDAGSATTVARAGAKAIATSSWSVAAANGHADGEALPLDDVLPIISRIVRSVDLPVTVDFEGGYAEEPAIVSGNVRRLLDLGVTGLNFEDQVVNGPGLYSVAEQTSRLRAVRQTADAAGVPLFINARTDVFLKAAPDADHGNLLEHAVERCKAYAEAGADGFFAPGLTDLALIRELCEASPLPVNVMVTGAAPDLSAIAEKGVARISFGPAPYIRLMTALEHETRTLIDRTALRSG